jgi:hypothetical protein
MCKIQPYNKIFIGLMICTIITFLTIISVSIYAIEISTSVQIESNEYMSKRKKFNNISNISHEFEFVSENDTLCEYMSQISIRYSNKIVTVCMFNKKVRVDIREFYSNIPSIKGIWFTINEWRELCKNIYDINKFVNFQQFIQEYSEDNHQILDEPNVSGE